jgi:hexokinase
MQELPQNLLGPIKDFEKAFTVDGAKLKEIVNHFVKELEKGTWFAYPQFLGAPRQPANRQHRLDC